MKDAFSKKEVVIFQESFRECWQTLAGIYSHEILFVFVLISDLHLRRLQELLAQKYSFCVPLVPVPGCTGDKWHASCLRGNYCMLA